MKNLSWHQFLAVCTLTTSTLVGDDPVAHPKEISPVLNFTMKTINGQDIPLSKYQGNVLLIVNVASECGYTKQYKDLEALYQKYKDQGFKILAFPANDFGGQEPGTNAEIKQFCTSKFNVTFDLFAKISANGEGICPLYKFLTDAERNNPYGGEIRWNFTKFLVNQKGEVVARFEPADVPTDPKMLDKIEATLKSTSTPDSKSTQSPKPAG